MATIPAIEVPVTITETRITNDKTGGQKGSKQERFDLLPWDVLRELARLYGKGAEKYEERNWEKGYDWSLSHAALHRHLTQFWQDGESYDQETGCHHLASVMFHAAALMRFDKEHPELDNRPNGRWSAPKITVPHHPV